MNTVDGILTRIGRMLLFFDDEARGDIVRRVKDELNKRRYKRSVTKKEFVTDVYLRAGSFGLMLIISAAMREASSLGLIGDFLGVLEELGFVEVCGVVNAVGSTWHCFKFKDTVLFPSRHTKHRFCVRDAHFLAAWIAPCNNNSIDFDSLTNDLIDALYLASRVKKLPPRLEEKRWLAYMGLEEIGFAFDYFTCDYCRFTPRCEYAYDSYNTDGDCVAEK